jgi:hypothetical protein
MGFTIESCMPHVLSAVCDKRAYEVRCPQCDQYFTKWHNWHDASYSNGKNELCGVCIGGHVVPQRNMIIGSDITNDSFWASLNKKVSSKPLTKRI